VNTSAQTAPRVDALDPIGKTLPLAQTGKDNQGVPRRTAGRLFLRASLAKIEKTARRSI